MDALRLFVVLLVVASVSVSAYADSVNEHRLLASLLTNYDKRIAEKPVDVNIGMALLRILDIDIDKNVVHLDVWMQYRWNDSRLRWDPSDFGDTDRLVIPSTDIWTPDITVYNSADKAEPISSHVTVTVQDDGDVIYIPPTKLSFYCNIKSSLRYHVRTISCPLRMASWAYNGYELNISVEHDKIDVSEYDAEFNKDVTLVSATAEIETLIYACCPEPYQTAIFNFSMSL